MRGLDGTFIYCDENKIPAAPKGWLNRCRNRGMVSYDRAMERIDAGKNVGFVPGLAWLAVVDVDKYNGTREGLAEIGYPVSIAQKTRPWGYAKTAGGWHLYYSRPRDVMYRGNLTWEWGGFSGETRCDNGYAVIHDVDALECALDSLDMSVDNFPYFIDEGCMSPDTFVVGAGNVAEKPKISPALQRLMDQRDEMMSQHSYDDEVYVDAFRDMVEHVISRLCDRVKGWHDTIRDSVYRVSACACAHRRELGDDVVSEAHKKLYVAILDANTKGLRTTTGAHGYSKVELDRVFRNNWEAPWKKKKVNGLSIDNLEHSLNKKRIEG